jgi:hypothetical protein
MKILKKKQKLRLRLLFHLAIAVPVKRWIDFSHFLYKFSLNHLAGQSPVQSVFGFYDSPSFGSNTSNKYHNLKRHFRNMLSDRGKENDLRKVRINYII